ncbi:MAG: hypothetical protein ABIG63_07055, partial [Chloroflexota bacterium]
MGHETSIEQRITEAGNRWPHLQFKRKTRQEAGSACPFCSLADRDGFLIFTNGGYWCRKCSATGWIDENDPRPPTQQELLEARVRELERRQREQERRLTALEEMARCQDHLRYHQALTDQALDYWYSEGMTQTTIDEYTLGYCTQCPTYRESPSYTIPVTGYGGELINIRHRLVNPNGTGKYRPHRAGLGSALFNASVLRDPLPRVIVTEGEKKAIIAQQSGFDTVGICGQRNFKTEWLGWFAPVQSIYIALDPDAKESA